MLIQTVGGFEQYPYDSRITKFPCLIQGSNIEFYGKIIQKASVLRDMPSGYGNIQQAVDITPSGSPTNLKDRIKVSTEATVLLEHAQVTSSSMTFPVPATGLQTADLTAVM